MVERIASFELNRRNKKCKFSKLGSNNQLKKKPLTWANKNNKIYFTGWWCHISLQ